MYLMLKDTEVLYFDFDNFIVQEICPNLVPFCMRNNIKPNDSMQSILSNVQMLKSYFSRRVLSLSRDNAKNIYAMFEIPQLDDVETRVKICILCGGISVTDSYWIKKDNSNKQFKDINIRKNKFKEIVDISLYGEYPSLTTNIICPELTTKGLFRKAWVREDDDLYLLKSDKHTQNINTRMEVLASKILKCFKNKIQCIEYTGRDRGKLYVNKCKNFVDDTFSFVEAWELIEYCRNNNIPYTNTSMEFASIGVLDYILANPDRHTQNYGFKMCNETGNIIGVAPLFDFNLALISDILGNSLYNCISQMFGDSRTMLKIAQDYKPYCNLELDIEKYNKLRKQYKEYDIVFENVLKRYKSLYS